MPLNSTPMELYNFAEHLHCSVHAFVPSSICSWAGEACNVSALQTPQRRSPSSPLWRLVLISMSPFVLVYVDIFKKACHLLSQCLHVSCCCCDRWANQQSASHDASASQRLCRDWRQIPLETSSFPGPPCSRGDRDPGWPFLARTAVGGESLCYFATCMSIDVRIAVGQKRGGLSHRIRADN